MTTTLAVIGAFVIGVCVGVALDDAWDLYRASRKERNMDHYQIEHGDDEEQESESRGFSTNALAALLLACCAALLVVGVSLIITRSTTEQYSRCTAEWQQQFSEAYIARVSAATEVSEAMDRVVISVQKNSKAEFDAAVQNYVSVRNQQNADRLKAPLPPLPEVLCGER